MTAVIPRARSIARVPREEYALSPSNAAGVVRGRPGPTQAARSCSSRVGSMGESPTCPGPSRTTSGNPRLSTSWWTFMDSPSRERPTAVSGLGQQILVIRECPLCRDRLGSGSSRAGAPG